MQIYGKNFFQLTLSLALITTRSTLLPDPISLKIPAAMAFLTNFLASSSQIKQSVHESQMNLHLHNVMSHSQRYPSMICLSTKIFIASKKTIFSHCGFAVKVPCRFMHQKQRRKLSRLRLFEITEDLRIYAILLHLLSVQIK